MYLGPRGTTHVYSSPVTRTHTHTHYIHILYIRFLAERPADVQLCSTREEHFGLQVCTVPSMTDLLKSVWHHVPLFLIIPELSTEDTFRKSFSPANIPGGIHQFPLLFICSSTYAPSPLQMHLFPMPDCSSQPSVLGHACLHFSLQRASHQLPSSSTYQKTANPATE